MADCPTVSKGELNQQTARTLNQVRERGSVLITERGVPRRRIEPVEPHLKSLDAIHLATCSILGFGITIVSHDASMLAAATSLSIDTFDPLENA